MSNTYDVYIQKWKNADGTISSAPEKLMFSIPQNNPEGFPMISPTVKCGEDSADSLDFSMNVGMEYYDLLIPLKTIIRVEYYGNTIFYGRVLTINASTVMQTRSVHCEGAFGFFNDSYYPATADTKREEISWSTYFDRILSNHNNYIHGDDVKKFNRGTVDFTPSTQNKKFEPTGWTQTSSMLSSLKDELGGHMLSRYSGGYNYIDWYKYHKRDLGNGNRPVVQVGENVIDISSNMDVGNLFTRVIPVGKSDNDGSKITINGYAYTDRSGVRHTHGTDYMSVSLIRSLYSDAELSNDYHTPQDFDDSESKYGIIYKTIQFSDAATPEQLWNECAKWIKESFYGAVTSFEIRAIDMHIQNTSLPLILLGDCVDIYYKIMENGQMVTKYRKMIAKSIKYDLFNPSNNSYSFGIPSDLLKTSKSQSSSKKKKTASEMMSNPEEVESEPDKNLTFQKIADIIRNDPDVENGYGGDAAADSFIENGEYSGSVKVYDATIHYDTSREEIFFTARLAGKITVSGKPTHWVGFNNAHGLFAFPDVDTPLVVGESPAVASALASAIAVANQKQGFRGITHWYIKNGGYSYTNIASLTASTKTGAIAGAGQFVMSDLTKQFYLNSAVEGGMISGMMTIDPQALNKVKVKRTMLTSATKGALTFLNAEIDKQNTITAFFGNKDDNSGGSMQIMDDAEKKIAEITKSTDGGGFLNLLSSSGLNSLQALADDVKNRITTSTKKDGKEVSTTTIDGVVGSMCSIFGKLGTDGSGDDSKTTITNDGATGKSTFFDLNGGSSGGTRKKTIELAAGSSAMSFFNGKTNENDKKTVEVEGNGTSGEGKINVGNKGNNQGWRVKLNETITYQDSSGTTHTLEPGFVSANDFHFDDDNTFNSLKTKILVADTIIAGKVTASTIAADLAYIRDLSSDTIKANRSVRAGYGYFTNGYITNVYASGHVYRTVNGNNVDLGRCYNQCLLSESGGVITLTMYPADGTAPVQNRDISSFNMAATTFYKNAVAASFDSDHQMFITGPGSDDKVSTDTLNPGQSKNYYPTFKKQGSGYQYGSLVKVSARSLRLRTPQGAVRPTTSNQTILPGNDSGGTAYDGLSQVVVEGSSNLTAGNIKSGVTIFGVTGTHEGGQARALYVEPDFSARYMNNYTFKSYTEKGGTLVDTVGGGATTGVNIPLIEAGAGATSPGLTEIPSGGITSNGNYKFPSGYAGIRYLNVNVSGGSSGPTKHDAFAVNVSQGPSGTVVTIQKTYPHGSSCPFVTTSSKNFYWY